MGTRNETTQPRGLGQLKRTLAGGTWTVKVFWRKYHHGVDIECTSIRIIRRVESAGRKRAEKCILRTIDGGGGGGGGGWGFV